ncbi:hypothetical protein [Mesonia maritima]|uniref:DUF4397 domain-containing protein n=1 Tax=Mesonia maritima TaxID=1793873 RepID=A0ABU1K453_9FLAO|nr:hypothetical protein [Mesonia maritima]MDR6299787.1 hypothetical protein [Mesonia maritima]
MKRSNFHIVFILASFFFFQACQKNAPHEANLRIGQFLMTSDEVEITLSKNNKDELNKTLPYSALTAYEKLTPGIYKVEVKRNNNLLLKKKIGIGEKGNYSLILYGIPKENQSVNVETTSKKLHSIVEGEETHSANGFLPQLKVLNDEFECAKNEAKVRWIHLAAGVSEISAKAIETDKNETTSLSTLSYPMLAKDVAFTAFDQEFKWNLKGNKISTAATSLQLKPEYLYTFFVIGNQHHYLDKLEVITGKTKKKKF